MHRAPADRLEGWADGDLRVTGAATQIFGAGTLLSTLEWKPNRLSFLRFCCLIGALLGTFLTVTVLIEQLTPIPKVALQVALWAGWLFWLGYLLPRHQQHDLALGGNAYQRAFWRELCFGIGLNFTLLLRPFVVGVLEQGSLVESPWALAGGLLLAVLGLLAILDAARQLGISCAFFVYEYTPGGPPMVVDRGVYGLVRHPLLLGGISLSVGLGICVGSPAALELVAVNTAVLLPYLPIEDHRCCNAVGAGYRRYREEVGGVLPRRHRGRSAGDPAQRQDRPAQHQGREDAAGQQGIPQVRARQARGQ